MPSIDSLISLSVAVTAATSVFYVSYRTLIGLLGLLPPPRQTWGHGEMSFLVLVTARNEEAVIGRTVENILALDYPADLLRVIVVADDCNDATAANAAAAGAEVLVKTEPARDKGKAVRWALEHPSIKDDPAWQAMIIFDADSRPDADFLRVVEGAFNSGYRAIQARGESGGGLTAWTSRAYAFNTTQRNRAWHLARERAGFSAALTGAGVCLRRSLLDEVPWQTNTLTEDLEYAAKITMHGVNAHFLYDAIVRIQQPRRLGASVGQRLRWARGQLRTTLRFGPRLLLEAFTKGRPGNLDFALYLALPSTVPFQMLLVGLGLAGLAGAGLPLLPWYALLGVFVLSIVLPQIALSREKRTAGVFDWLCFVVLMFTWIPVAFYAAVTLMAHNWRPTPKTEPPALPEAVALAEDN
jgi:cellulose synthase/poly-beta-1,6-N-acetylglucosamine synthase-like glycosyltransferase